MNHRPRTETATRNSQKCSACRHRKKKCSPNNRDWENSQQKCEFCESHGLPCGPKFRYSDDPAIIRQRSVLPETASTVDGLQARGHDLDGSTRWSAPATSASPLRGTREGNDGPKNASRGEDRVAFFRTLSVEDLERHAFSKLEDFHKLGNILAYVSQSTSVYCPAHEPRQSYHDLSIEEKLHELFIYIHSTAIEANARNEHSVARSILCALMWALDRYPHLCDSRKRHILLKIALMFQELGHRSDSEYVLLKVASISRESWISSAENPFCLLATSFLVSSTATRRVLRDRWNETVGGNHFDLNLNVPPLHFAVQHRYPNTILALLSDLNERPAVQPGFHLNITSDDARSEVDIEARDSRGRTALFAAVVNGDMPCCATLLFHGADANTRDDHGHTALEVAVRKGSLDIVKALIERKANVNPIITYCSSLPLHVAIESETFKFEIIQHLLNSGAEVDNRRSADNKHAIDLAVDRGYNELAKQMRQMIPDQDPSAFMIRDSFISHISSPRWEPDHAPLS